jgi:hypothetical protein
MKGTSRRAISWPLGHFEMGDPQTGKRKWQNQEARCDSASPSVMRLFSVPFGRPRI